MTSFERGNLKPYVDIEVSKLVLKIALLACSKSSKNVGLF